MDHYHDCGHLDLKQTISIFKKCRSASGIISIYHGHLQIGIKCSTASQKSILEEETEIRLGCIVAWLLHHPITIYGTDIYENIITNLTEG